MTAGEQATTTGAESVLQTLAAGGVTTCFANPGTSEMHLVAGLDAVPGVHAILCLFEGVASGAADGCARMTGDPAATLLHLGPGLGNAFANLHNAYKARTPLVNLVGEHAVDHRALGAPLATDIEAIARPASHWVGTARGARDAPMLAARAVAEARSDNGGVATLVLPADAGWSPGPGAAPVPAPRAAARVPEGAVVAAAEALRSGAPAAILLGGHATHGEPLELAARIAAATGAKLVHDTFVGRIARGAGAPAVTHLPYLPEPAEETLGGLEHLVVVGTQAPVAFFGYPGRRGTLADPETAVAVLAGPAEDATAALRDLAEAVGADTGAQPAINPAVAPELPTGGSLDPRGLAAVVGATLAEGTVVVDESVTAASGLLAATAGAAPHDWLFLTGGSIGFGIPLATGAAVGAPDRHVLNLQADGSAMYTLQGLWTQAREGLDVTTLILANRSYAILDFEMTRTGATPGAAASALFDLGGLDFCALAEGMGVPARRVQDPQALAAALRDAQAEPGPHLVEAVLA